MLKNIVGNTPHTLVSGTGKRKNYLRNITIHTLLLTFPYFAFINEEAGAVLDIRLAEIAADDYGGVSADASHEHLDFFSGAVLCFIENYETAVEGLASHVG